MVLAPCIDTVYSIHIVCGICSGIMKKGVPMTGEEVLDHIGIIEQTVAYNAGRCTNMCRSRYREININAEVKVLDIFSNKYVEKQQIKHTEYEEKH